MNVQKQTSASGRWKELAVPGTCNWEKCQHGVKDGSTSIQIDNEIETFALYAKFDHETIVSLDGSEAPRPGWSAFTLELRIGRSTVRPFIGLTNTHAGTNPTSSWFASMFRFALLFFPRRPRIVEAREDRREREISLTTRHQPSSNDSNMLR